MRVVRRALLSDWPAHERRVVAGSVLALLGAFLFNATWNVIILSVQQAFAAGVDGEVLLRQLPDISGLLAVPVVGALGARVTGSRIAGVAAVLMVVGAACMAFAPSLPWLVGGASVACVGRSAVSVIAFAAVGSAITDGARRTTAFAALGAAPSVAFMVGPVCAGALVSVGGWRMVSLAWATSACALACAAWLMRVPDPVSAVQDRREPWTPILAGITLVGVVQAIGAITLHGPSSVAALAWCGGTLVTVAVWVALARRLPDPALDGRTLRVPGLLPMLLVALIAQCGDLWFYVAALLKVLHRLTALQMSLAMLAAQCTSLLGACCASWLIRRIGLRGTGTVLLGLYAAAMFGSCAQTSAMPAWFPVGILSVAALAELGAGVCVTQAVMACAPRGFDRPVSACRSAATGVGNALTLLLVAGTVGSSMGESMERRAQEHGVSAEKVEALVEAVRSNVATSAIGHRLGLDAERLRELREARHEVMIDGFRTHGWVSGAVLSVAAAGFWLVRREPKAASQGASA